MLMKYLSSWYCQLYTLFLSQKEINDGDFCLFILTARGVLKLLKGVTFTTIVYICCPEIRAIYPTRSVIDDLEKFLFSEFHQHFEKYLEVKEPEQVDNLILCFRMVLDRSQRKDTFVSQIINSSNNLMFEDSLDEGIKRDMKKELILDNLKPSFERFKMTKSYAEIEKIVEEYAEADYSLYGVTSTMFDLSVDDI